jgi:hypothetical protein
LEAKFGADISGLNSRESLESLRIANGNQEAVNSVFLVRNDKLSKEAGVGAVESQIANPPLGGSNFGSIDDESLSGRIVGCSGHQTLHIGPVGKLSLGVAAHYLSS